MASQNTSTQNRRRRGDFSGFESYMLRRFHPQRIIIDVVGWTWIIYFLWQRSWKEALVTVLITSFFGYLSIRKVDAAKMARNALGRLALLHAHPANILIQLSGFALAAWGVWDHSSQVILVGLTVIGLGHFFGWGRVNDSFESIDYKEAA